MREPWVGHLKGDTGECRPARSEIVRIFSATVSGSPTRYAPWGRRSRRTAPVSAVRSRAPVRSSRTSAPSPGRGRPPPLGAVADEPDTVQPHRSFSGGVAGLLAGLPVEVDQGPKAMRLTADDRDHQWESEHARPRERKSGVPPTPTQIGNGSCSGVGDRRPVAQWRGPMSARPVTRSAHGSAAAGRASPRRVSRSRRGRGRRAGMTR